MVTFTKRINWIPHNGIKNLNHEYLKAEHCPFQLFSFYVEPYNCVYTCYIRLLMYLSIIIMMILACPLANLKGICQKSFVKPNILYN